jgi:protein SCO1/2
MSVLRYIRFVAWIAVAALAAAAGLVALGVRPGSLEGSRLPLAATIGGPFALTDQNGRRITDQDLLGKPFAVFFGFTNCPDICPTTLLEMANRLQELGPDGDRLRIVFVSVDPEQDTAAHLKTYVTNFDDRILALTGTAAEIQAIARAYRVIYERVPTSTGYTINHTATVYLMDAKGQFAGSIAYQEPAAVQREKLRRLVARAG